MKFEWEIVAVLSIYLIFKHYVPLSYVHYRSRRTAQVAGWKGCGNLRTCNYYPVLLL